ncbi:hypothetical protein D3C81_1688840 [compost metagenome]
MDASLYSAASALNPQDDPVNVFVDKSSQRNRYHSCGLRRNFNVLSKLDPLPVAIFNNRLQLDLDSIRIGYDEVHGRVCTPVLCRNRIHLEGRIILCLHVEGHVQAAVIKRCKLCNRACSRLVGAIDADIPIRIFADDSRINLRQLSWVACSYRYRIACTRQIARIVKRLDCERIGCFALKA